MIRAAQVEVSVDPRDPPEEFPAFFRSEHPRLVRALYLLSGDPVVAEDLAQEALVRVFERWDRVRSMTSPVGYLYRTALNLHRSRLRRLAVRARSMVSPPAPVDPALAAELRDELGRALAALPSHQRVTLVLVEWLGMSAEEAAAILGVEPVTVRVRLARARSTLRDKLGGTDG